MPTKGSYPLTETMQNVAQRERANSIGGRALLYNKHTEETYLSTRQSSTPALFAGNVPPLDPGLVRGVLCSLCHLSSSCVPLENTFQHLLTVCTSSLIHFTWTRLLCGGFGSFSGVQLPSANPCLKPVHEFRCAEPWN